MDAINCKNKNKPVTEEQKQRKSDYQKQYRKKHDRRTKAKIKRLSKKNILQHE